MASGQQNIVVQFGFKCSGNPFGCRTNQDYAPGAFVEKRNQGGIITAFVFAPQNHKQVSRKGFDGFDGGIHIGRFRIVKELNLIDFRDPFQPMLDPVKSAE
jgi:hypothetical protein